MTDPLLRVEGLKQHYPITTGLLKREIGRVRAVDGISFDLYPGETLGLVGESGCGKSTAARTILRLEDPTDGQVFFDGEAVTEYSRRELKRFRRRAQMIFQDPTTSFDPRMTVGDSVGEPLRVHGMKAPERRRRVVADLLERVGLSAGDVDRYPHEFSGGQRQRLALARALVVNPELIVADEPVSALDVSIQASILSLIEEIQAAFNLAILFISHDMAVVREVCDRVAVMYLGEIVELAPTETLFADPKHPYTRALLSSIPRPDPRHREHVVGLHGDVPDPADPPSGCRFHTRCPEVIGPKRFDLEGPEWRAVMDLRQWLAEPEIDLPEIRQFIVAAGQAADVESVTNAQLSRATREEFGIPEQLGDSKADKVLDEALSHLVRGSFDEARRTLAEAFATPCESQHPTMLAPAPDRQVACHLHDPSITPSSTTVSPPSDRAAGDGGPTESGANNDG
ncbi:MAG: ABC transporter ATP-binding protein [Halobacteriales archaeon]|nr:ABC transporter ATP-binding protein [Halobacteriales archaeon]